MESSILPPNEARACVDEKEYDPDLEMPVKIKVLSQFLGAKVLAMAEPVIDQPVFDGIGLFNVSNE